MADIDFYDLTVADRYATVGAVACLCFGVAALAAVLTFHVVRAVVS